ncbi:hypothetical protein ACH4OY_17075 [Micromonospora rubida]|uniref:Uncharacterized protein n=1 Tax=Micromonospora rubida TaxID=2697657 RepID=A0ABW7SKZ7_9ACTN
MSRTLFSEVGQRTVGQRVEANLSEVIRGHSLHGCVVGDDLDLGDSIQDVLWRARPDLPPQAAHAVVVENQIPALGATALPTHRDSMSSKSARVEGWVRSMP